MLALLFVVSFLCADALGQQSRKYPPHTLVTRSVEYNAQGEEMGTSTSTRYQSASGDWRSVSKSGVDESATLYRRGKGVYQSNSRTNRIIKMSNHAPGCPLRTAEELRADKKFARTEQLLDFTAYVWIERPFKDLVIEHYFIPELGGGMPIKQVSTYTNGPRFVMEPVSIKLGEPHPFDISGPDYFVIEQEPVYLQNINQYLLSKPEPEYPTQALNLALSGSVNVMVTVDDTGNVISAGAQPGNAQSTLRQAAVEAAYKATFKPIVKDGQPVVAKGTINYQFVLPK